MLSIWSDDAVARLVEMAPRHTASQIAAKIGGGITRNAVIGKANRMGISLSGLSPQEIARRNEKRRERQLSGVAADHMINRIMNGRRTPAPEPVLPGKHSCTLLQLTTASCRWPFGESPNVLFCGARSVPGLPYCIGHCRMAYRPARPL